MKEEDRKKQSSSTPLKLPSELSSVGDTLKVLNAAIEALKTPSLDKTKVVRFGELMQAVKSTRQCFEMMLIFKE